MGGFRRSPQNEDLRMTKEADPRTTQFFEVAVFGGILLLIHLGAFVVARSSMNLISIGYLVFCCLVVPLAAVAGSIILRSMRGWHWGQVVLVALLALLLGFVQFLIVGSASAAV